MEEIEDFVFEHPANAIISGPSGSGKSEIAGKILASANALFPPAPTQRILFYREDQPIYEEWVRGGLLSEKFKGVPEKEEFLKILGEHRDKGGSLVFFDDFSSLIQDNREDFVYYFTIASHHYKASMFLIIHSLFSPALRLLSLNTHRFFLTKSARDVGQVRILGSQSFPGRSGYIVDSFEDATSEKYGFLLLDYSPNCDKRLRVLGNIFNSDGAITVYEYKRVLRSKIDKMDQENFRKKALIPWNEYLRLKEKNNGQNNVGTSSSNCSANNSVQIHPNMYQSDATDARPNCNISQSTTFPNKGEFACGQSKDHRGQSLDAEVWKGGDTVSTSAVNDQLSAQQGSSNVNNDNMTDSPLSASPIAPKSNTSPPPPLASSAPALPVQNSHTTPPSPLALTFSTPPIQNNRTSLPLALALNPSSQLSVPELPLASNTPNTSPAPGLGLQYSQSTMSRPLPPAISPPLTQQPLAIDYIPNPPRALEVGSKLPAVRRKTTKPQNLLPIKGTRSQVREPNKKQVGDKKTPTKLPQRALENMQGVAEDSSYPPHLYHDADVGTSPLNFPSPGAKKKKKSAIRPNIFRPSPPISNPNEGTIVKTGKRKAMHLTKPRPSFAKYRKLNQGEKRKNTKDGVGEKKKKKQEPFETDFDIW